jgi:hypothetical protein
MAQIPDELEVVNAADTDKAALQQLHTMLGAEQPPLLIDATGKSIPIPTPVLKVVQQALTLLAAGASVRVVQTPSTLSIDDTAALLNASTAYVTKLVQDGVLLPDANGEFNREDVLVYKQEQGQRTHEALEELVRLSEEMGLYDMQFTPDGQAIIPADQDEHPDTHE